MYKVFLPDVSDTAKHLEQLFNHVMVSGIHRKILLRGREGERKGREGRRGGEREGRWGRKRERKGGEGQRGVRSRVREKRKKKTPERTRNSVDCSFFELQVGHVFTT